MERVWGRLAGWLIETLRSALPVHRVEASWIMLLRKRRLRRAVNFAFVMERHASCKPARKHPNTTTSPLFINTPPSPNSSKPPSLPPLP